VSADPYAPPEALLDRTLPEPPVPRAIRWQIRLGAYAGMVTAMLMGGHLVRTFFGLPMPPVYVAYNGLATLVIASLAYGTLHGGRTCAVLLFLTFLIGYVQRFDQGGNAFQLLWLICFAVSIVGTFRWHALRAARRRAAD